MLVPADKISLHKPSLIFYMIRSNRLLHKIITFIVHQEPPMSIYPRCSTSRRPGSRAPSSWRRRRRPRCSMCGRSSSSAPKSASECSGSSRTCPSSCAPTATWVNLISFGRRTGADRDSNPRLDQRRRRRIAFGSFGGSILYSYWWYYLFRLHCILPGPERDIPRHDGRRARHVRRAARAPAGRAAAVPAPGARRRRRPRPSRRPRPRRAEGYRSRLLIIIPSLSVRCPA